LIKIIIFINIILYLFKKNEKICAYEKFSNKYRRGGGSSLGVLSFSYPTDKKLFVLDDAFPHGICGERNGRCCWRYQQLAWYMGYDSVTAVKANDGTYYRTCDACKERWVWNDEGRDGLCQEW
jgi:hypothetical protein